MQDERLTGLARRFAAAREAHERPAEELERCRTELLEAPGEEALTTLEGAGYRFRLQPGSTYLRTSRKLLEEAVERSDLSPSQREDLMCAALVETEKKPSLAARRLPGPDDGP